MAMKLSVLRSIVSEIRNATPNFNSKENLAVRYILDQYRKHKVTDEQLCKAKQELEYMANSYLCYLRSSRIEQKLHDEFHGKGERTTEETANLVGFKLPQQPK